MAAHHFARNFEAGDYLESFLIAAVATVLGIRAYLDLTGYPQIGGDDLHIAHMLWGGLMMLASVVMLLSFLSRASMRIAAVLGGIGFGTFIDEVGKFVTRDNDYFYEPAIAIIYVTFVVTFLIVRIIRERRVPAEHEYLLNAVRELEEVVVDDLDKSERRRALGYLEHVDPAHPLREPLTRILRQAELVPERAPTGFEGARRRFRSTYRALAGQRAFVRAVEVFFVGQFVLRLAHIAALTWDPSATTLSALGVPGGFPPIESWTLVEWVRLVAMLVSGVFLAAGVVLLGRARLGAYLMFKRSLLVTLFVAQPFIFYEEQLSAMVGLTFNLLMLVGLELFIHRERELTDG